MLKPLCDIMINTCSACKQHYTFAIFYTVIKILYSAIKCALVATCLRSITLPVKFLLFHANLPISNIAIGIFVGLFTDDNFLSQANEFSNLFLNISVFIEAKNL